MTAYNNTIPPATLKAELPYWLALWRAPRVGPAHFSAILAHAKSSTIGTGLLSTLFKAGPAAWKTLALPSLLQRYLHAPNWRGVEQDLNWLAHTDHKAILMIDPLYPPKLAQIANPPPILFVRGEPRSLSYPHIAIVGSRNASPFGMSLSHSLSADLTYLGLAITSGLALGIDGQAHRGALLSKGVTVAVLGTGPERIYPREHTQLAEEICNAGGAIVSELPVGTPIMRTNFPRRNRLISGLSLGVLVVEASLHSGSLITARLAAEQGRDVFAVPGAIGHALGRGCNHLIRQGAKLCESINDILEELPAFSLKERAELPTKNNIHSAYFAQGLDENQFKLLQCVGFKPTPVDNIIAKSGFLADQVLSILLELVTKNYVSPTVGSHYIRMR